MNERGERHDTGDTAGMPVSGLTGKAGFYRPELGPNDTGDTAGMGTIYVYGGDGVFRPEPGPLRGMAGESADRLATDQSVAKGPSTKSPRPQDAARSMMLLRERIEFAAERLGRQVGALNGAKLEAFGYVADLETLDASSFEETVNGRLGLVEHHLDRLENVVLHFGTTH